MPGPQVTSVLLRESSRINKNVSAMIHAREENKKLNKKLNELTLQQQDYREILLENQRLKDILDYRQNTEYCFVSARIIGQTPAVQYDGLIIDKGRKQGIIKDMTVVAYQGYALGVVGRITESGINTAKVLMASDEACEISAMIQRSREQGIVSGFDKFSMKMKYLLPEADVSIDDMVITSGLGGIFPKGIRLGRVKQVIEKKYALYKEALLVPEINVRRLEEVLVAQKVKGGK